MQNLHDLFPDPIIIDAVEAFTFEGRYLVRATSADGDTGVVTVNNRLAYLWPILEQFVAPYFTGKDARDVTKLVDGVYTYKSVYKLAGIAFWNPVAYAELSVLDLLGRLAQQPVGALYGEIVRSAIPVYLSSLRRDTTPEEEVGWLKERLDATGADAVKLKIGGRMSDNADAFPGRTDRLIPLARETFGDDGAIYVDANGSYDGVHAIEVGHMLEDYGVAFLEEPCPWQEYWETKQAADGLALPVAGGEQDSCLPIFDWMIRDRVVDLVQPDVMYNGGMTRIMRVAAMAEAAGMSIMPHSPKVGAEGAAVLQFCSVAPNLGPHQEWRGEFVEPETWYTPAFEIENGTVALPGDPGLGVEYDPSIWDRAEKIC
jgi:L-alanine-DL-glutamate epimerase-like enolase superfamily enzyme